VSNHDINAVRTRNLAEAVRFGNVLVSARQISDLLDDGFSIRHLELLMDARLIQLQHKTLALTVAVKCSRAVDICERRCITLNIDPVSEDEGSTGAKTNIFAAVTNVGALKNNRHKAGQQKVGQAES